MCPKGPTGDPGPKGPDAPAISNYYASGAFTYLNALPSDSGIDVFNLLAPNDPTWKTFYAEIQSFSSSSEFNQLEYNSNMNSSTSGRFNPYEDGLYFITFQGYATTPNPGSTNYILENPGDRISYEYQIVKDNNGVITPLASIINVYNYRIRSYPTNLFCVANLTTSDNVYFRVRGNVGVYNQPSATGTLGVPILLSSNITIDNLTGTATKKP